MQEIVEQLRFFSELGVTHLNIESQKASSLEKIREEIGDCRRCKLWNERTHIVYGMGSSKADLMFVGEAPGREEDVQGIPFVGRSGKLLTGIIEAIDLKREDVYIANILKCRPPKNRNPEADEVESCEGFLFKQIEVIKPKIIVALGAYAAQCLLQTKDPIGRIRGRFFHFQDSLLLPTFHPAYLLRNPSAKRDVWEDIKVVRDQLKELGSSYYS